MATILMKSRVSAFFALRGGLDQAALVTNAQMRRDRTSIGVCVSHVLLEGQGEVAFVPLAITR